ncbi:MAG: ABC transporter substrate-binding protein [Christensenellales bacterium]
MKKFYLRLTSLLILVLSFTSLFACGKPSEPTTLKMVVPTGAPALAVADLFGSNPTESLGYKLEIEVVSADAIVAKVTSGEADMAIMPTNTAAVAYSKGTDIKLVSSNVFGLLYMVGKEQFADLSELKGKVVYNIGQGKTSDALFQYILDSHGIGYEVGDTALTDDKVYLAYVSDGSELPPMLKTGKAEYAILGEPAATKAREVSGCVQVMDIQAEWQSITGQSSYPQASFVMKTSLTENTGLVSALLGAMEANVESIKENPAAAGEALASAGVTLPVALTEEIVGRCNIRLVKAADAKVSITSYLTVLYNFDKKFVGGTMPDDDFYLA